MSILNQSGPLTDAEVHAVSLAVMPYLLEDGRRSNIALLIARLIATIDATRHELEEINSAAEDRNTLE